MTRYNTESQFPTEIDDLLCISDIDLQGKPIMEQHKVLLDNEQYTDAGNLLEASDIDSLCASLFCLLENRIYATQEFLSNKHTGWYEQHGVESPIAHFTEPEDKTKFPLWDSIEDISRIGSDTVNDEYHLSEVGGFRA